MQHNSPILQLKSLQKIFDNGYQALHDINLDIYGGEFLAVIGLSGSGKSTLLRCMNGLYPATSGKVIFKDMPIQSLSKKSLRAFRAKMAMIFQQFNLIESYTVQYNVLTGILHEVPIWKGVFMIFSKAHHEKAKKCIEIVGLSNRTFQKCKQLSGGQKQRVSIARALMQSPDILLADEPVASLDPSTAHSIMDYLKKINQELGITIVCSLHFLSLVRNYATRVIAMKEGRIVFEGKPEEISEEWFKKIYGEDAKEVTIH